MKKLVLQGMLMFGVAGSALAAGAAQPEGSGYLVALFLGFAAVIVVFQIIPSIVVFVSVVKEIFAPRATKTTQVAKQEQAK